MRVDFVPRERSAFDEGTGISILQPRILPCEQVDSAESIEYQYTFVRQGERVGALGLFGHQEVDRKSARPVWTYTLNLAPSWVLRDILRMKSIFGSFEPDFDFLQSIARGLVMSFAGQTTNSVDLRYVAFTSRGTLISNGLSDRLVPDACEVDEIVLAEVRIPSHFA
ncbi:MAG: hypothetical protein JHC82_00405 [Stenotrophomonas sp.]|nr:hypothetical protein [Stenotrophomonas sp.]